eukprot:EC124784.1.p1 GENE.EC124784.1~~EC124784.1.p1  ORF type:complete len:147 (+),score=9.35 EC124784.1:105-545(+)
MWSNQGYSQDPDVAKPDGYRASEVNRTLKMVLGRVGASAGGIGGALVGAVGALPAGLYRAYQDGSVVGIPRGVSSHLVTSIEKGVGLGSLGTVKLPEYDTSRFDDRPAVGQGLNPKSDRIDGDYIQSPSFRSEVTHATATTATKAV